MATAGVVPGRAGRSDGAPLRVAVIGCGYWGPNLVRNFQKLPVCDMVAVCDRDPARVAALRALYPHLAGETDSEALLADASIDAVAIATPVSTHYTLARAALLGGKHVLVSKPMTVTLAQAEELIRIAREGGRVLMVDHTFVYTGAVRAIRDLVRGGELGEIHYFDSVRVNLGLLQPDVNVLWDLGPHDFSIMDYVLGLDPVSISAVGVDPLRYSRDGLQSVGYVTVRLQSGPIAHFSLSWLSPVKIRRTLISGSRRMVVYDHLDPDHQVKVYDRGVELHTREEQYKALVQYRAGDMYAPKVDQTEALEVECGHFIACCRGEAEPVTGGEAGRRIVRLLEAAQQSMERGGEVIPLAAAAGPADRL